MDCKFYVGQKVVCVNDTPSAFVKLGVPPEKVTGNLDLDGLKAGRVYTISGLSLSKSNLFTSEVLVELKEIVRPGPHKKATGAPGYDFRRFKPLDEIRDELRKTTQRKTDISIFQKMCEKQYTDHEIAELLADEEDA